MSASTPHATRRRLIGWCVAAMVLVAVAIFAIPAARDTIAYRIYRPAVDQSLAAVNDQKAALTQATVDREQKIADVVAARVAADDRLKVAQDRFKAIQEQWISADKAALAKAVARPFNVQVTGPATAVPGAPNQYQINVTDPQGRPLTAEIDVAVKTADGKELFATKFAPDKSPDGGRFLLPPAIWSQVKSDSEVFLSVTTVDKKTGARSDLTESIRLFEPTFTTYLTTDKPMYRPGETVYFRSLTLDRTRFLPPANDIALRFEIKAPSGQVLPGSELSGLAKLATLDRAGKVQPVLGPDAQPVRGIGSGNFALAGDLVGGEYTLNVFEVPLDPTKPAKAAPLAVRKFTVNNYTPDRLQKKLDFDGKGYGPGAVVQAKFEVKEQATPIADADIRVTVTVDGEVITPSVNPTKTDKDGTAAIRFTLPKKDEIKDARVDVFVTAKGISETITKKPELATRKLNIEFFPEGGDLVAGVSNRVYFRATNNFGKPTDIVGTLTDGNRDIASIRTLTDAEKPEAKQGLGSFEFTPEAGKKYAVNLSAPLGVVQPIIEMPAPARGAIVGTTSEVQRGYLLPAAKAQGVILRVPTGVVKATDAITVKVTSTDVKRTVLVGAYTRGRPIAHQTATLEPGKTTDITLTPTDAKLGGVTRITVFDAGDEKDVGRADLKPLAERLVYRQPGELLKLNAITKKANGEAARSFIPGSQVQLDVISHDENGKPVAAVLWATVVNESVLTMADEKTARLLPTHFLLSGEVQKGEDLEHADFLLTDHPTAATTLDLLLGTQGWRRFAEQAPAQFRKTAPAEDADRLMVASAIEGPIPTGWRTEIRQVTNQFWPKYEAADLELDAATRAITLLDMAKGREPALARAHSGIVVAESEYKSKLRNFGEAAHELAPYDANNQKRQSNLPIILIGLLGVASVTLLIRTVAFSSGSPERRYMTFGSFLLVAVAAAIAGSTLLCGKNNDDWRAMYAIAPKPERGFEYAEDADRATAAAPVMAEAQLGVDVLALDDLAVLKEAKKDEGKPGDKAGMGGGRQDQRRLGEAMPPRMPLAMPAENFAPVPAPVVGLGMEPMAGFKPGRGAPGFNVPGMPMAGRKQQLADGPARDVAMAGDMAKDREQFNGKREADNRFHRLRRDINGREERYGTFFNTLHQERQKVIATDKSPNAANLLVGFNDFVPPQVPSLVVREYAHVRQPSTGNDETRKDFTETLLWQPVIVTPVDGRKTINFTLSDATSPYRVMVAGHTLDGRLGAMTSTFEVRKPFSLDPKLPQEISSSDKLDVTILGANATDAAFSANVKVSPNGMLVVGGQNDFTLDLQANNGGRKIIRLAPEKTSGTLTVNVSGMANGHKDSIDRTLTVVQDGFPANGQKSDVLEQQLSAGLTLPNLIVPGSLKLNVTMYPNTLSEVQSGLDGLLREPSGCFEQTSTNNYPNVMILNYLNETGKAAPDVSGKAKQLIDRGYQKLISFECQDPARPERKGYEWFGGSAPPHEALTAYGLLQFTDMSRVAQVDGKMIERTKKYLLSRRDGKGGFERNSRALDSFGYAPEEITNAYIIWAITEAERTAAEKTNLDVEFAAMAKLVSGKRAKDPYFLALVANSLINNDKKADGIAILKTIAGLQGKDGSVSGSETSITRSSGNDLLVETTALAVLGWLKVNETGAFRANVDPAARWMGSQRGGYGAFGGTQSTILALKALVDYARSQKRPSENGTVRIMIAGAEVAKKAFTTEQTGPIVLEIPNAEELFKTGKMDIRVETDAKQAYPCTIGWECRTRKPNSSADCPVELTTKLSNGKISQGDTVRLDIGVKNLKKAEHGMVVAVVGIPAGLKLPEDMKQLKAMTVKPENGREQVSYWEIRGRELILYWRGMGPNDNMTLGVDLIADHAGEFRGPASRAYLYYGAEHKHWVDPVDVTVTAK